MRVSKDVVIVGAGPYGLAVAKKLHSAGWTPRVFGEPLQFWMTQTPLGMLFRSPIEGTDIGDRGSPLSLRAYCAATGRHLVAPIPADVFCDYGIWFAEHSGFDVDRRNVERVERTDNGFRVTLDDDASVETQRVVVAAGIGAFGWTPPQFDGLPVELASHTLEHRDLSKIAGNHIVVVGGGQSALESAALLTEAGRDVEIVMRESGPRWLGGRPWLHKWPLGKLLYSFADVGPAGISQLVARPQLFRLLSRKQQDKLGPRAVRPAGARGLRERLANVPIRTSVSVKRALPKEQTVELELSDGSVLTADHVLLGTGYRVDLAKFAFLSADIVQSVDCEGGYPVLSSGFESSVPGLYFVGAPAAWSFGPLMRFVAGSGFTGRQLVRKLPT